MRSFQPIFKAQSITATVGLGKSLDLSVSVKTKREAQAVDAEKALAAFVTLATDELGRDLADLEEDAAKDMGVKDLVKVFKFETPDKTAFEEAHALFRINGDRVKVDQLDLIGKAVCLGGSGEVDTSGEYVKFEFYTMWSRLLKQMINTPVGDFSAFVSKNLFKIKMTREGGELKYKGEPIPLVTEPVKGVVERWKARAARWK